VRKFILLAFVSATLAGALKDASALDFDDLLKYDGFFWIEDSRMISNAIMGRKKGNPLIGLLLKWYDVISYKTAYINLSRTKIYAPVSGKVARKNITIGQKLMPNQAILVIVDLNNIWVDANLKETQMKDIKIGDKVELKSDINGKEYEGKIIGISAGSGSAMSLLPAQNASGNWIKVVQRIPVKIAISKKSIEKNGVLPIGSSMEIDVKLKKSSEQNNDDSNFELLKSRATKMYQVDEDKLNAEIQEIINKNK